jgi:macrodomain Ter protein organizer (MatP/YcbG family)
MSISKLKVQKKRILSTTSLITTKKVIPAPYQVWGKLQQESRKTLDSGSGPE